MSRSLPVAILFALLISYPAALLLLTLLALLLTRAADPASLVSFLAPAISFLAAACAGLLSVKLHPDRPLLTASLGGLSYAAVTVAVAFALGSPSLSLLVPVIGALPAAACASALLRPRSSNAKIKKKALRRLR